MTWIVERRRVAVRGSLELGTAPTHRWEPDPAYPAPFATRREAKAAVARSLFPGLPRDASEAFVCRHFDQWARNEKHHRVRAARRSAA